MSKGVVMPRRIAAAAVTAVVGLTLTGCAGGAMTEPTSSPRPPFQTTTPGPLASSGTPAGVSTARWDAIRADLAARGISATPALVSAQAVTWQNGALGCPRPGASYTEARVEGMQVVVRAGDDTYDYRFGRGDAPVLCTR